MDRRAKDGDLGEGPHSPDRLHTAPADHRVAPRPRRGATMLKGRFFQAIAMLGIATGLASFASTAEAQNTCNAFVAIAISPPGVVPLGGTRTITVSLGTDG